MNRRNFIKRAALGLVGLATGWGLLKSRPKVYGLTNIRCHSRIGHGTLYNFPVPGQHTEIRGVTFVNYPDVFRATHYPIEGQSWDDFFKP